MDHWEAETGTALLFEQELGEYDIIEGVRVCIHCFIASIGPILAEQLTFSLIGTASTTR